MNSEILIPFYDMATRVGGSEIFINSVACGIIAGMIDVELRSVEHVMEATFAGKSEEIIRKNKEVALAGYDFVRNNFKQASPATDPGYVTKVQMEGVVLDPLHPLEMAIALGAGFVARGYSLDIEHLS